jgi:hypothetical protein
VKGRMDGEEVLMKAQLRGCSLLFRRSRITVRGMGSEEDRERRESTSSRWFVCSHCVQYHFRRGTLRSIWTVEGVLQ